MSNHRDDIRRYVDSVLASELLAGELERAAAARHAADLAAGVWEWNGTEADRACRFVELLRHSTGEFAGRPFRLEPWQKFVIGSLFAWTDPNDGRRRFRDAHIEIARGNGKSPLAAAIALYLLAADREPRAEIRVCATEREQAGIVWHECRRMVEQSPALARRAEIRGGGRVTAGSAIKWPDGSALCPLGKEAASKDGLILHGLIIDEIHAFRPEHGELIDKLTTALGKRRQPLAVTITTAGNDRSTLWLEAIRHAEQVARGVVDDPRHFAFVCRLDPEDDLLNFEVYRKANPNLGLTVRPEYLCRLIERAKTDATAKMNLERYHANRQVSAAEKPLPPAVWELGALELPDLAGRECHAAIDLGWRDDLAALVACWPIGADRYALKLWAFIPADCRRDLTRPPWSAWINSGVLKVTPGNTTDPAAILAAVAELQKCYQLRTVALDPNNARAVGVSLVNDLNAQTFEFFQTTKKYNEPLRGFIAAAAEGRLIHGGCPLLAWAADNLTIKTDAAGLVMPDKAKSAEKIDPIVAAVMAYSECIFGAAPPTRPRVRIM